MAPSQKRAKREQIVSHRSGLGLSRSSATLRRCHHGVKQCGRERPPSLADKIEDHVSFRPFVSSSSSSPHRVSTFF